MLELTLLQFLVAAFMSLGGVCVFVWAVLSGQFNGIEEPKFRVFEMERDEHERD
ncbi:MAG: cbb3-type cytochrome oxidase assembly protein [Geminicoccales bacterium]